MRRERTVILLDNFSHPLEEIAEAIHAILEGASWKLPRRSVGAAMVLWIQKEGLQKALQRYRALRSESALEYDFSERELNTAGYTLLRDQRVDEAIGLFRLNVEQYPGSYNVFDSLGEALAQKGELREAIGCFEQAIKLNPGYAPAAENIRRLRSRLP